MVKFLISIFLQSIPETLIILSIGLTLIGYEIKQNLKTIAFVAVIFSFISYIVNQLPILFGIHTFVQVPILIILVMIFLKQRFRGATLVVLVGMFILILFEGLNIALFNIVLGFSIEKLSNDLILSIFVPYIHFTCLTLLIIYLKRKNITLLPLLYSIKSKKISTNIILTFIIIFLSLITIVLYFSLFVVKQGPFNILSFKEVIRVLNILLFVFLIIMAHTTRKLLIKTENQTIAETQELYLKNLNDLHTSFRSLRHDFSNQVQILSALINNNEIDEAKQFINSLCQNINVLNKATKVKNPVITALLQAKFAFSETNGINFSVDIKTNFDDLPISDMEFTRILGNLLDNAFDATLALPIEQRLVSLTSYKNNNLLVTEIKNSGLPILEDILKSMFNSGITTKAKNHSGLGLTIVKKILTKYKGDIGVRSDKSETVFTFVIPIVKKRNI